MGATYNKLDFWQLEKIWELRSKRVAGAEVARLLGKGFADADPPVRPIKITPQAVNAAYRQQQRERNALYFKQIANVPTAEVLAANRRKLSQIAAAELERQRILQEAGKLDGIALAKLATAIERIERMEVNAAKRDPVPDPTRKHRGEKPDQVEEEKPRSFADSLSADAERRERELAQESGDPVPTSLPA